MRVLLFSLGFHGLVFVIGPLISKIVWKENAFGRPKTFQLVTLPRLNELTKEKQSLTQQKKEKIKSEKTPVPSTDKRDVKPKERVKETPEDLSELENLLGGLRQPVSDINFGNTFNYSWYERNIMLRVEQNWKPPIQKSDVFVILSFTIRMDGSVDGVTIKKSSGNSMIDNLAIRAVTLASPFGKLPPAYDGRKLDIDYTLNTVVQ
jgi:TonB family protein